MSRGLKELETVFAEVAVEGEGVGDGLLAHDDEAGGVDEAEGFAAGAEHVGLGDGKLGLGDVVEVDERKQFAVKARDMGEPETGLNQRPRLKPDVVCRHQAGSLVDEAVPDRDRFAVPLLRDINESEQGRGIDKGHHDFSSPRYLS